MKFKIKWSEIKSDPLHIVFVIAYALGFSLLISLIPGILEKYVFGGSVRWRMDVPFVDAGGMRIAEALDRFAGKEVNVAWTAGHTRVLISILLMYVISLPLFAWGLRQRALWRQGSGDRKFPTKIVVALGLSGSFVMGVSVVATVPPFIALSVRNSLMKAQTEQTNKDVLISDISYIALKAQTFYFVDVKDGGGGGRWKNIRREGDPTLGIEEIAPVEPIVGKVTSSLFPQEPSRFLLTVHTQDSLTVWGIGKEEGDVDTFANEDGRKGRLQMKAVVTPKKIYVNSEN